MENWQTLVSKSHESKHKYQDEFHETCPYVTNFTRWYAKYDVAAAIDTHLPNLEQFLKAYQIERKDLASLTNLLTILSVNSDDFHLQWYVFFVQVLTH